MPKYEKLDNNVLAREEKILKFWEDEKVFAKSLQRSANSPKRYVFYEGPPTANGKPHLGHLIPRVYKDLFPRYKTMQGFYVGRKGGWDTHGLPVELEVEKELGLNSKRDIESYGVENFVNKCKESVWRYKEEWERMIQRMGFWIDLENAYITYTTEYIESVWWALKKIWKEGLLYKGHKVLPYCPRCGTPLSSHEVAQGYKMAEDPSIFVKMPVQLTSSNSNLPTFLLMWTTTPWTVPANVALAVGKGFTYAKVKVGNEYLILAKDLVDKVIEDEHEIIEEMKGKELVGLRYEPPFKLSDDERAYRVVVADFVNLEEGTGIVHIAPAFGEEDYELAQTEDLPFICPVDLSGNFTEQFKLAQGRFVKDADNLIIKALKERGFLYKHGTYQHEYPFCWRCDTPLLYYATDSYFIKTTAMKDEIIRNNRKINWYPEHIREGRFGDFLANMKDWALSRDRYWGTPLNIWVCQSCKQEIAVGSKAELTDLAKDKRLAAEVELHRPYIDEVLLKCPKCNGDMKRVPYVIDAWFDSGMMHTAQWHYPFENSEEFEKAFPADFIAEGLDQTRGWFYSLLVTSTLLYNEPSYKNVIVTGLGLDKEGKKMSKSLGNVLDPWEIIDTYGADALRWYLYSASAPWKDRTLAKEEAGKVLYSFLDTIRNVYNFFVLYAKIDRFDPKEYRMEIKERELLDRWIISRLNSTIKQVTSSLDSYDVVETTRYIEIFVEELSNWYVRSSRKRFWGGEMSSEKISAYLTLYHVLLELAKLLAPLVPFLAESIYQGLRAEGPQSVHLCSYPVSDEALIDIELEKKMALVRRIVALGRAARMEAKIKVRQPLTSMAVKCATEQRLTPELERLVLEELNIKKIEFVDSLQEYLVPMIEPDFSKIGPKFGRLTQGIKEALLRTDPQRIASALESQGRFTIFLDGHKAELTEEELKVKYVAKEGYTIASEDENTVVLETKIDPELRQEGYIRELIHQIQLMRKEAGYEVTDRIKLFYQADEMLKHAIAKYAEHIKEETLAVELYEGELPENIDYAKAQDINGQKANIGLIRVRR